MTSRSDASIRLPQLAILAAGLALAACGGGGNSGSGTPDGAVPPPATPPPAGGTPPATPTAATTPGVWKGTISSTTTGQSEMLMALTDRDGQSVWMTTDGRIWHGNLPPNGDNFDAKFDGHMYEGVQFPDGSNHGPAAMRVEHHSASETRGHYSGSGDDGTFHMALSPMWDRPASHGELAGVYTRSTSNGYTMTMTLHADGQLSGSDSRGCVFGGTVTVPDPQHNLYHLDVNVSACGSLDGHYRGTGTLLDADAMRDWMTGMHPLEHGGHSHGGSMMPGGHHGGLGENTVPTGQHNLFMYSMYSENGAIMDALGR